VIPCRKIPANLVGRARLCQQLSINEPEQLPGIGGGNRAELEPLPERGPANQAETGSIDRRDDFRGPSETPTAAGRIMGKAAAGGGHIALEPAGQLRGPVNNLLSND
jgi:hypothetical protein